MDKNAVIDANNCEDDIPLLEVRTSPDAEENIQKASSESEVLQDSASTVCEKGAISEEPTDKQSPNGEPKTSAGESKSVTPESESEVLELKAGSPTTTAATESASSESNYPDHKSSESNKVTTEPPNNSSIIVQQQLQKKVNTPREDETKLGATSQPGVIQLSNPMGTGGTAQSIKVDISHLPILSPAELTDSPVRKLELTASPEVISVKQEEDKDDDLTLQCDEKIGDSPELESKQQSRVHAVLSQQLVKVERWSLLLLLIC